MNTDTGSKMTNTPPALPTHPRTSGRSGWSRGLTDNIHLRFWWIVGAAALLKIGAYFLVPQPPSTVGGHVGALLLGFIVYAVILGAISAIVAKFFQNWLRTFKILFCLLFSAACIVNLAFSPVVRGVHLASAHTAFEALMTFEDNPLLADEYDGSGIFPVPTGRKVSRQPESDAERYFGRAYCYANGHKADRKDIPKAVDLCRKAASEKTFGASYREKHAIERARHILSKSGLSWPGSGK
jgi:hypothetical protein